MEECCRWLNFLDGLLTAHALSTGKYVEINVIMRVAWGMSPLAYGTLKFWLLWAGMRLLGAASMNRPDLHKVRIKIMGVTTSMFVAVVAWHLWVLSFSVDRVHPGW
jgi:hypothetical protein